MSQRSPEIPPNSKHFSRIELRVRDDLLARGWTFLFHDVEILGVQIDLLMRDPAGLLGVIEVKTQGRSGLAHVAWRQRGRLMRVAGLLAGYEPVELHLALVAGGKITLLPVD